MLFRAPDRGKWRSTADLALQTPRAAVRLRERKIWRARVLQSGTVGWARTETAFLTLEEAPFCAIFRPFFIDFPRVFSTSLFGVALWARNEPSNWS
jgi:hypothetical protein